MQIINQIKHQIRTQLGCGILYGKPTFLIREHVSFLLDMRIEIVDQIDEDLNANY